MKATNAVIGSFHPHLIAGKQKFSSLQGSCQRRPAERVGCSSKIVGQHRGYKILLITTYKNTEVAGITLEISRPTRLTELIKVSTGSAVSFDT